ncbi:hypothetical protein CARUB_v10009764mg [Capsella rubella]|uniref:Auxin-responsive protein n=1 Tax=Capsella rubella TaxID=81985 RepID=R0I3T7_9BRAS|nr:auxin-responsive protein IAA12 [Capsella rubella]EOA36924.1 hypothetical protein CARUB_v10009764mg [Capsella rubella]
MAITRHMGPQFLITLSTTKSSLSLFTPISSSLSNPKYPPTLLLSLKLLFLASFQDSLSLLVSFWILLFLIDMRGGGRSELEVGKKSNAPAETELELGLGLSLGGGPWRERGRILTAKDFPSVGFKRAADSSSHQGASPPRSSQVVGWPPIGSHRMNSLVNNQAMKAARAEEEKEEDGKQNDGCKDVSVKVNGKLQGLGFVKVNMDGVGIGRKVDMRSHSSYEDLAQTLEEMFFGMTGTTCREKVKPLRLLDGSSEFVLTYEDKEGDWMLVGDVPWRMFINSVKRLRIMGTSEANGLAPRHQEQKDRQRNNPVTKDGTVMVS